MIRKAHKEDIVDIEKLGKEMYNNFHSLYNLSDYMENENYIILVSETDSIEGFLIAYHNFEILELQYIIVSIKKREKGIATKLLKELENKYTLGIEKIILEVNATNMNAIRLYLNNAFKLVYTRKKYYGEDDALIMEKVIN